MENTNNKQLITNREEIVNIVKSISGLEKKFENFVVPESKYTRFDSSDIKRALEYVNDAQLLELYKESMKVYDDAGIARP